MNSHNITGPSTDHTIRMFSVYSDLKLDETESDDLKANKAIQYERDKSLFVKIKSYKIPSFPMDKFEFIHHIENFKKISMEDDLLCLIFVSNDKTHVLKEGKFMLFNTMIEAFKWCQNIGDNTKVEYHNMKYMVGGSVAPSTEPVLKLR